MDSNKQPVGVVIPPDTVADSKAKRQRRRTFRQLPVYRDMANLKYCIVKLYGTAPRKYTKYIDSVLATASEAKKCVGLAALTLSAEEKAQYLTIARAMVEDIQDDITILHRLGQIGQPAEREMKSLAKRIVAQTVAWRDYENSEGYIR